MKTTQQPRQTFLRLRTLLVTLSLALGGIVGVAGPASAANNYPWSAAVAVPGSTYIWGYTQCPANNAGCKSVVVNGTDGEAYGVVDPWGYYIKNCTSWLAWTLHDRNGFDVPAIPGNAAGWGSWASGHGYTVNSTPAKGAVAWWGAGTLDDNYNVGVYGHVAYVESVSGNAASIEEYNYGGNGAYHTRTITASSTQQVKYIHFADITDSSPEGSARDRLRNGGFNNGGSSWERVGTGNFTTFGPSGTYEGSGYGAANATASGSGILQDVILASNAGKSYCVSARVRTTGGGTGASGSMAIYLMGITPTESSSKTFGGLGTTWTPIETCVTATGGHSSLRVQFYPTPGGATLGIDAVDMQESLINTAGFNSSSAGWSTTGSASFAVYGSDAYEGSGYGAVNAAAGGGGLMQDKVRSVSVGSTHCLEARVRSNVAGVPASGSMVVYLLNSTATESSSYQFTDIGNAWTPIKTCVTAAGAHSVVRVQFYPAPGDATVGVDAVSLHATLAKNGGFNGSSVGWVRNDTANFALGTTGAYEGSGFAATNATTSGDSITLEVNRSIVNGDSYCVSAQVRTATSGSSGAGGSMVLWLIGSTPESSSIQFANLSDEWQPVKTCVAATREHSSLRVQFYPAAGTPTMAIDAVDLA